MQIPAEAAARIRVTGIVQGVGFRPFIFRLANELGLFGWVRNDANGVEIEAHGDKDSLATLLRKIKSEAPDLARVDGVIATPIHAQPQCDFVILESLAGHAHTGMAPDTAICEDCLTEILTPSNRRFRYPFSNCTHCGPRYTITRHLPYDRPNTSMAKFPLCKECRSEYDDPADRRFHAQPNACPVCGPRLALLDANGKNLAADDPIAASLEYLYAGKILAIKGLGGLHLMCDARNGSAITRLRQKKQRDEKPFAVMLAGAASVAQFALCSDAERSLLESRERPIVLLKKREGCDATLTGVAQGLNELGVLLPYTPLHYLLFFEAAGRPESNVWLASPHGLALVCTSANPGGEPLVTSNEDALARLNGIADFFLLHDRDILVRCDDSVVRSMDYENSSLHSPIILDMQFIRRARGYTPRTIKLAKASPAVLACGGMLKNTVCLTRDNEAFLSQHIGDLDNAASCRSFEETVRHLMNLLEIEPKIVVHDLHPDFFNSRFAADFARQRGIAVLAVQHHHAHIAAVMAEHGLSDPILGLALDGVGLGSDGKAWGGELLRVKGASFERIGHLHELALPGGDRAAREPWRMAASALNALGRNHEIERRFSHSAARTVRQMLEKNCNSPGTSSCGRLFDAAAGLLGVRDIAAYEGQAAMLLESMAQAYGPVDPMAGGYTLDKGVLNFLPLLATLSKTRETGYGAALFHATLSMALAAWITAAMEDTKLNDVVLGGGCFLNQLLGKNLAACLEAKGAYVYQAQQAPPNDGGLSLGQAWIAMQSNFS